MFCDAQNGEWARFNALEFGEGASVLEVRVASATNGGVLEIRLDGRTDCSWDLAKFKHRCWQEWVTKRCELTDARGKHDVFFKFVGDTGILFNASWWKFLK